MTGSKGGSQEAKSKRSEEIKTKIKSIKAAYKSLRFKLEELVNYRSPRRNTPKLTKAISRIQGMEELLLVGANDEYSPTELLLVSNDTMMLLLNSTREEVVRDSTLNMRSSPCTTYYTAGSQ